MKNLNPYFFIALAFFSGIGYLNNGGRGALIGAMIFFGISLAVEFLDAMFGKRRW